MKHSLKFSSSEELLRWFIENHMTSPGVWIRFEYAQKPVALTPEDALRIAVSYGWVDDRIKRMDDLSYRKKFIPRRDGSEWTDAQKALVAELAELGVMEKPGLDAVARARLDGSWNTSAQSPVTDAMLETFTAALRPYETAFSVFLRLPSATQKAYAVSYCNAKRPETRARRLSAIVQKVTAEASAKSSTSSDSRGR